MLEIVAWIVGIYLAIGLLWTAFAAFFSIGLRLPFTLRDNLQLVGVLGKPTRSERWQADRAALLAAIAAAGQALIAQAGRREMDLPVGRAPTAQGQDLRNRNFGTGEGHIEIIEDLALTAF
jgi:hypothetical protein